MTKTNTLILILIFISQLGFSQKEKSIKGKVTYNDSPVKGIEVLNLASKKTSITNEKGEFSISGKPKDTLVFVSTKYDYKNFILDQENIKKNNIVISLTQKVEELNEIEIPKTESLGSTNYYNQGAADEINLQKAANNPKPLGVYDGALTNSTDLIRVGGMILSLFSKEKETTKEKNSQIHFKGLAKSSYTQEYFTKTMQLKPEEIDLFLEFCDADPQSKRILEDNNPLSLMEFLLSKRDEFKNLKSDSKK